MDRQRHPWLGGEENKLEGDSIMNVIEETLSNVHIGPSASFRNLTIYPIFGATRPNDYVTLDEALANGAAVEEARC